MTKKNLCDCGSTEKIDPDVKCAWCETGELWSDLSPLMQARVKAKRFLRDQEERCNGQDAYDEAYDQGYANLLIKSFLDITK